MTRPERTSRHAIGVIPATSITVFAIKNRFDFIPGVVAVCFAGYAAVMLDYVAHDDLGFSSAQIGQGAVIAAILLAVPLAMDLPSAGANKAE